jgi:hypothetical protein
LSRGSLVITALEKEEVLRILFVCVVLDIYHARRMRRITLSSVACPSLFIFLHNRTNNSIFFMKVFVKKCVFRFSVQTLSEKFLILRRNEQYIIHKCA